MDRRASLATLFGKKGSNPEITDQLPNKDFNPEIKRTATVVVNGLEPYTGPWGTEQAAHLLRRVSFGPNYDQIKAAVNDGMDLTLMQVLTNEPVAELPLNHRYPDDVFVPIGETWTNALYPDPNMDQMIFNQTRGYRADSMASWLMGQMMEESISIREKMTLFWHNHFPVSDIQDPKYIWKNSQLLREYAIGNFRELTKAVTVDPAMLRYLNGRENSVVAPNENYARELLELFTVGKGPIAGPGDYTNYTEGDIREVAKVLTGWRDIGRFAMIEGVEVGSAFVPNRHDTSSKQLSNRFNNAVITAAGNQEYVNLIDVIFEQDECARFICRKLYRWFVYYDITPEIEANIIVPMAQIMIDNDYNVKPALDALFRSAHFYDSELIGCKIKNPIDFITSLFKTFKISLPSGIEEKYRTWGIFYEATFILQMAYYNPPSVSGWVAYYQAPGYYQLWINSVTLPLRFYYAAIMVTEGFEVGDQMVVIDSLAFVDALDNPAEIDSVIEEFTGILFPRGVSDGQAAFFKQVLIPGLPDFEWNVEYSEYASDPGNQDAAMGVRNKVRNLILVMSNMPEFQLS